MGGLIEYKYVSCDVIFFIRGRYACIFLSIQALCETDFSKCLQNVFRNKILSGQDLQMLGIYSFCVISVSMSKYNAKQYFQKW